MKQEAGRHAPRSLLRLLVGGVGLISLVMPTLAWACVPQPLIVLTPQATGPPRSTVTVMGQAFVDKSEIRWNGLDGPLLGTATGTSFSTTVTIPETAPGLYAVIALVRQPGGSVGSTARAAFEVTDSRGLPGKGSDATGSWNGREAPETTVPRSALALAGAGLLGLGALIGSLGTIVVRRFRAGVS